jgi:hypothetical protein
VSYLREPRVLRVLNEPVPPLPVRRAWPTSHDSIRPGAPVGCLQRGRLESGRRVLARPKSEPCLGRRGALQDSQRALPLPGTPSFHRRRWRSFLRDEIMSLAGSNDRPVPEGANPVLSGAAGSRKAAERLRLVQALRANLGRRKAQKKDRRKLPGDAAESKTAQGEGAQNKASTKQD